MGDPLIYLGAFAVACVALRIRRTRRPRVVDVPSWALVEVARRNERKER